MSLDWDKLEEESQSQYKPYAEEGIYTTTIDKVELVKSKVKGTPGIQIHFADNDEFVFPKFGMTVWLGEKVAWYARPIYMKHLLMALGIDEESAKKAVESCEDKTGEAMNKAYHATIERAVAKNKGVEVAVYRENPGDEYPKIDFADPKVRIGRTRKEKKTSIDDVFGEEEKVEASDIPF